MDNYQGILSFHHLLIQQKQYDNRQPTDPKITGVQEVIIDNFSAHYRQLTYRQPSYKT